MRVHVSLKALYRLLFESFEQNNTDMKRKIDSIKTEIQENFDDTKKKEDHIDSDNFLEFFISYFQYEIQFCIRFLLMVWYSLFTVIY